MILRSVAALAAAGLVTVMVPERSALTPLDWSVTPAVTASHMRDAGRPPDPGKVFIGFDSRGDGRVTEVVGDLRSATRIAVIVPGSDITLDTFDRVSAKAHALYDALPSRDGVAVVAWLGYDTPEGLGLAAAREDRAQAGALELQRFITSLPASTSVVLIGHSYGTVVVDLALPAVTDRVTDAVFLASPGLPYGLPAGVRAYSATAEADWMNRVPKVRILGLGHGAAPHYRPIPVDGVKDHDGYFKTPSTLDALAQIVAQPLTSAR